VEFDSEDKAVEWIAEICLQAIVVPLVGFMLHLYSKRSAAAVDDKKKIVDLERAITKKERDAQFADMENKVNNLRTETRHSIEEINQTFVSYKGMLDRIFAKLDKAGR
jgi:hypothetical protein